MLRAPCLAVFTFVLVACGPNGDQGSGPQGDESSSLLLRADNRLCGALKAPGVTPGLYGLCVAYCSTRECPQSDSNCAVAGRRLLDLYNERKTNSDPAMPCGASYHWRFVTGACEGTCGSDPAIPTCNPGTPLTAETLDGYGPHTCDMSTLGRYIEGPTGYVPTNPTVRGFSGQYSSGEYWFGWVMRYMDATGTWDLYPETHLQFPANCGTSPLDVAVWQCVSE
jgi:hypothetical protein